MYVFSFVWLNEVSKKYYEYGNILVVSKISVLVRYLWNLFGPVAHRDTTWFCNQNILVFY